MDEKKQKNAYRNSTLSKAKNFPIVKETLGFLQEGEIWLDFDTQQKTYVIVGCGKVLYEFKNGVAYNKMKKDNLGFSILWAFSDLEYNSLKEAYYKIVKLELMSPYKIAKYLINNSPK